MEGTDYLNFITKICVAALIICVMLRYFIESLRWHIRNLLWPKTIFQPAGSTGSTVNSIGQITLQANTADMEMSIARRDISKEKRKVKWIKCTPSRVRDAFLEVFIRPKHVQWELDEFGGNLLHIAARLGRVDLLKLVVYSMTSRTELASLALEKDIDDLTALHLALKKGIEDAALYLIEVRPEAAYLLNQEGVSPLYLAIESGYEEMVRCIFQLLPGTDLDLFTKENLLRAKASIVHAAVRARNLGILERITEELPDSVFSSNEEGWAPLSFAAYHDYLDEVRFFLEFFPKSAKFKNKDGSFPIHKAVGAGHVRIVEEFLSYCPSTIHDVDNKGQSNLHIAVRYAIRYARADVFSYLINHEEGKKLYHLKDHKGRTFTDLARKLKESLESNIVA